MARRTRSMWKQILQDWWQELAAILLVVTALSLATGRALLNFASMRDVLQAIARGFGAFGTWAIAALGQVLTIPNILAVLILLLAGAIALRRVRYHLRRTERFVRLRCPCCDNPIYKKRRHLSDRLASVVVPVRRYGCKTCHWEGWRIYDVFGGGRVTPRGGRRRHRE